MEFTEKQLEQIKKDHPEWFKFTKGSWYKSKDSLVFLFNGKFDESGHPLGYGFINESFVCLSSIGWKRDDWEIADNREVKELFMKETKKRYNVGDKLVPLKDYLRNHTISSLNVCVYLNIETVTVLAPYEEWFDLCSNPTVFSKGVWAEKISPIYADIQALRDKYPDYDLTIKVKSDGI